MQRRRTVSSIRATVTAARSETRILIADAEGDLLVARLGPLDTAHRYALRMLLEALALWNQQSVDVVLCADDSSDWQRAGVVDALGLALETLLFKVELVAPETRPRRRAKRLSGLGSFAPERRLLRSVDS
jgi:hypothetical protein